MPLYSAAVFGVCVCVFNEVASSSFITESHVESGTHCDPPHTLGVRGVNSWVPLAPDHSRLPCNVSAACEGWSGEQKGDVSYSPKKCQLMMC